MKFSFQEMNLNLGSVESIPDTNYLLSFPFELKMGVVFSVLVFGFYFDFKQKKSEIYL